MITGYNISPLPFYDSLQEQFANHACAFGVNYPLLCSIDKPLPFLFHIEESADNVRIVSVSLVQVGVQSIDVTNYFVGHGLALINDEVIGSGQTFVRFMPDSSFSYRFPSVGNYYLVIGLLDTDVGEDTYTYYSEVFCVTDRLDDAIEIEYTSPVNIATQFGNIPFNDDGALAFAFKVYINALIGKPQYNFEETETNRNGYSFLERAVSKKTYQFTFMAPEYLCDALRLIKLCSEVTIKHKGKTYEPITFDMNARWEEQGDLASVNVSFDTDNILTSIGGYTREPEI